MRTTRPPLACLCTCRSNSRGDHGHRTPLGRVHVDLSATLPPGSPFWAVASLMWSYVLSPHTLPMHTSGVMRRWG